MSACYYDPYYNGSGGASVGGSYSSGGTSSYGHGYGYGGSNFSTSFFVSTGSPQWGYDPYCSSYYDYHRHCYYDPYLHGYYPVGYRPAVVVGCPHPYGYRSGYCPPPTVVNNVNVVNYNNRVDAYRRSNYGWARQVRANPGTYNRPVDRHPQQRTQQNRPNTGSHPSRSQDYSSRPQQARPSGRNPGTYDSNRYANSGRQVNPSGPTTRSYNNPGNRSTGRQNARNEEPRGKQNQGNARGPKNHGNKQQAHPNQNPKGREEESRGNNKSKNSVRYLGQG